MQDLFELINDIQEKLPLVKASVLDDAKQTGDTWEKAIKYLKDNQIDYGSSYHATAEDQLKVFFNAVLVDEIDKLVKESRNQKIKR